MVPGDNSMLVPTQATSAGDEPRVLCIIRDLTNTEIQSKFSLNLPASTIIRDFIQEVATKCGYENDTFLLSYERPDGRELGEVCMNGVQEMKLGDICDSTASKRNNFSIMEKDGIQPVKDENYAAAENTAKSTFESTPSTYTGSSSTLSSDYGFSYASAVIKSDTGYVGLVNQAMTCYLNSLLQTLFMTPEFRNAIYRWEFDGTEDETARSIPYQLQRLFLQLQTSKKRALETTDITKSFGWDSSESWQQHDVQELCRVMFDALEKKWRNTDQANLINHLYQGQMKDYVKCLECGYESARNDTYLDIPLVIRPFGANQAYGSVEEALRAFVQPETLDGNNQYYCEKCGKKCDAHKGLKFQSFPYLLTLQLKRFDFDYNTMHRIKLNDRMAFPEILNLNALVSDGEPDNPVKDKPIVNNLEEGSDEGIDMGDGSNCVIGNGQIHDENNQRGSGDGVMMDASGAVGPEHVAQEQHVSEENATNTKNAHNMHQQGPYEYELFSIMIHSGSAAGGHYYAYIKSFKGGQWYSFNDQHVSTITYDDICKTYGGSTSSRGYYSSAFASSTNAYMLMYRQIDKQRNKDFLCVEALPRHLKDELEKQANKEEAERKQREIDRNTCKIKLFCFHPVHQKLCESKLEVNKDTTLRESIEIAWKQFELEDLVTLDCVRLVRYDEVHDWVERSYDPEDIEAPMGHLLGGVKSIYSYDLLMEVKRPDQTFQHYKPGGVTVKVHVVDLEEESISAPINVRAYTTQTLSDFKELLSELLGVGADNMRIVLEKYYYNNELRLLSVPNKTLKSEGFLRSNKVFVEYSGTEDDMQEPWTKSNFYKILDRYENTIRININLPPYSKEPTESYRSKVSPSDSNHSNKSREVDEGIGESETEVRDSPLNGGGEFNTALLEGFRSNSLSETGKESSQSTLSSVNTTTSSSSCSEKNSPDDPQAVHIAQKITEFSGGGTVNDSGEEKDVGGPSGVMDTVEAVQSGGDGVATSSTTGSGSAETRGQEESWDTDDDEAAQEERRRAQDEEYAKYFRASVQVNAETNDRSMTVYVDKRMSFGAYKNCLVPYVGVSAEYFRVYRVYGSYQETEITRFNDTLASFGDDVKMVVKLGRALKKGEHRVKLYHLQPNELEVCKLLLETIFSRTMTVLESKHVIVSELRSQCDMDLSVDSIRLRRKTGKNPGNVYLNSQTYDDTVTMMTTWDIYLEILDDREKKVRVSQLQLYVRPWWPSKYLVGPLREVTLEKHTVANLKEKISVLSGLHVDDIEFAKGRGIFPCETSVVDLHSDLDWNPDVTTLGMWPLHIYEDGNVIYFRDKNEKLVELSSEKKKEMQQKENARLSRLNTRSYYSPRKERALKIYTDEPPSPKHKNSSIAQTITDSWTHDLD